MREEVEIWWKFALRDLRSAKKNYEIEEYYVASFLSQQAVEKALKSLLIKRTGRYSRIHDLTRLAKILNAPDEIIKLCANITPAYTITRYPDVFSEIDKEEAENIIKDAEKVIEWVKKELK